MGGKQEEKLLKASEGAARAQEQEKEAQKAEDDKKTDGEKEEEKEGEDGKTEGEDKDEEDGEDGKESESDSESDSESKSTKEKMNPVTEEIRRLEQILRAQEKELYGESTKGDQGEGK